MPTVNVSNITYTLSAQISPITLTCNINAIGLVQPGIPQVIEGFGTSKAQVPAGGSVTLQLINNVWKVTAGSFVTPPVQQFISSVANTATINLAVTANQLTASFASLLISQFTNDSEYIDLGDLSAVAPLVYDNTTGAFSIPEADSVTDGYLSSTDWNTFNSKEPALTKGNLTAAGTDGITVTNGTGAVIGAGTSVQQQVATAAQNGYLSAANFTTFNNKQATISVTAPITLSGASVGIVNQGTTTTVLHGNAAGNASFSAVDLAADVTGITPLANGGTNSTQGNIVSIYCNAVGVGAIADGAVSYFGAVQPTTAPSATSTVRKISFAFTGTLIAVDFSITPSNAGCSNEPATLDFQNITAGVFTQISNAIVFPATAINQSYSITGLSAAVTAGDEFNLRFTLNTMATNPSSVFFTAILHFRV